MMGWSLRKPGRRRLTLACVVVPATFAVFAAFASAAFAGNFFATGHDQDFHCVNGDTHECAYYKLTSTFVRGGSTLPVLILDRDSTSDGAAGSSGDAATSLEAVQSLNLAYSNDKSTAPTAASPPYVVEDPQGLQPTIINGAPPAGITTASTWASTPLVDGSGQPLWSAIIVASDTNCGGCDLNNTDGTHVDSDAINARTGDIEGFFNAGGGLLYLAGATDAYDADGVTGNDIYYASVPVTVGGQPVSAPFTVTAAGKSLGITTGMANCCATHNSFTLPAAGSPLSVAETDSAGLAESLFIGGGSVCTSGFCKVTPTSVSTSLSGGGASGSTITVPAGTPVTDSASLSGDNAGTATGTVTYNVYSDPSCSTAVSSGSAETIGTAGSLPASASVSLTTPGTYYWVASYSGDGLNSASQSTCGGEVQTVTAAPATTAPKLTGAPTLSGKTKPGSTLTCSTGTWTGNPTGYTYQWYRNGTLLAGVTGPTHKLGKLDEGTTYTCVVTARNAGGSASATSNRLRIPIPHVPRCPAATGRMSGTNIGPLKLGMTRKRARFIYRRHSNRGRRYQDFFCLTPIGIRVGYATPILLRTLTTPTQNRVRHHVVWASTANPYYSLGRVRPGESIVRASRALHTGRPFHIGRNFWYLSRKGRYTAVLKVRRGVVDEIGIATNTLSRTRQMQNVLMHSFY